MCGICGIVNFNAADRVDGTIVGRMTEALAHRGPDDEGYFIGGPVGLGHRRLSIIDLEGGKQPMLNEDGSAVIVFNGEVYNYGDLTPRLEAAGHVFRTRSDTETILHAYEQYGEDCVQKLRGMFAFAIWDRAARRLFLARDRLGIKPVYYYTGRHFFAFASEIKALLEIPSVPREVDQEALDLYLSLRYVPGPRTMFKHIFRLQPGHILVVDGPAVRVQKYWDIEYPPPEPRPKRYFLERFLELLEESVRLRLIAEVPLGVFLSGGLDSSSILAVMSRLTGDAGVKAFSIGYQASNREERKANEFFYARVAAETFVAEHHEYRLNAEEYEKFVPELVWLLDEPLADSSSVPLYFISRLAREHITVVLSGEGADEILGGYNIYPRMLALDRLYRSAPGTMARWAPRAAHLAPWEPVRRYLRMSGLPCEAQYRGVCRGVTPELHPRLVGDARSARSRQLLEEIFGCRFDAVKNASPLNRMLYVDTKVWLPDDLLIKADKMTMASGVELRVPFLDHKLVEFAATLPDDLKVGRNGGKALLRSAMQQVLPDAIIKRSKKGFPTPIASWLRSSLKDFARDSLLAPDSACARYLDPRAIARVVREHDRGHSDRCQEIWTLLVFEFWHRLFIDGRLRLGDDRSRTTVLADVKQFEGARP